MCIEDIAVARRTYTKATSYTAGSVTTLSANVDRLALIIGCETTSVNGGSLRIFHSEAARALGHSWWSYESLSTVNNTYAAFRSPPVVTYATHGHLVMEEMIIVSVNSRGTLIEIIAMPELANEVAKELRKISGNTH